MGLSHFDLALVALYLVGITVFGLRFRSGERSLKSYFLADKQVPWWAIALSIVAAETSTLTIISVPGLAYDKDFSFLQLVLGYLIGRVVICFLLLPQYFKGELFTAYQLIDRRFGPRLHKFTAGVFLLTRAAAEGVRVYAVSLVVSIALGFAPTLRSDLIAIGLISVLTLLYTFEGGLTAVIWTDVVQMAIYMVGTAIGLATILHQIPGGWGELTAVAGAAHKFHVFNFSWSPAQPYTLLAGLVGGAFLTTASHGTDQLMVQRLLAARSQRESRVALLSSGVFVLMQFSFFLLVGAGLYVLYHGAKMSGTSDKLFPTFIVTRMPHGISGLLIAAILAAAMSNLSAALNSLASTTVIDFYARWFPQSTDRQRVWTSRWLTVVWGVALFGLAILSRGGGRVVEVGLAIASVAYGGLLGVFLLGTLTKRATEMGAIIGMICGLVVNTIIWQGARFGLHVPTIAFTWYVPIGSILTFVVGYGVSLLGTPAPAQQIARSAKQDF
jgi:solute:Na+ symporter, SSS family